MAMMQMRCPHCTVFHAIGPSVPSTKGENPFWLVSQHINAQHPQVTFLCPRRNGVIGNALTQKHRDFWCVEASGDKTCSYCGSLSEADLREILQGFVSGKPGYRFATTDKPDKVYANRPGVNSGAIKFHLQHLSRDQGADDLALAQLFDQAIARELGNHG
jgi:hypothetical protein